jgi:NADH-quinone oxidoreductase subunit A
MPDNYFARYLPLLIHFLLAGALASALVLLSWIIGYRKPTRAKLSPYECGMTPIGDARERFSVKFYLVAMLFILFDVEAVFLYPWAIILKDLKRMGQAWFGISEMFVYIGIVLVGFWYIWKKGALDWGLTVSSSQGAKFARAASAGKGQL